MAIFVNLSFYLDPLEVLSGLQTIPVTNFLAD